MAIYRQPLCPLCGAAHALRYDYIPGKKYLKTGSRNFWAGLELYDPANPKFNPFGVEHDATGKGSFSAFRYYDVAGDVEGYFPYIKSKLLNTVEEWLAKGWLADAEVRALVP